LRAGLRRKVKKNAERSKLCIGHNDNDDESTFDNELELLLLLF